MEPIPAPAPPAPSPPQRWSTIATGLERRLRESTTTAEDRRRLDLVRRFQELRGEGKSIPQVAAVLGLSARALQKHARSTVFAAAARHLEREQEQDRAVRAREHLLGLIPRAQHRLAAQLDAGVDAAGHVVPSPAADRAMRLVLESAGLTEPEGPAAAPVEIHTLVIQQRCAEIRADEAWSAGALGPPGDADSDPLADDDTSMTGAAKPALPKGLPARL